MSLILKDCMENIELSIIFNNLFLILVKYRPNVSILNEHRSIYIQFYFKFKL